jgi:hypothetical protein
MSLHHRDNFSLPDGLSEADLCDLINAAGGAGDGSSGARAAHKRARLAEIERRAFTDPRLAELVRELRRDALALGSSHGDVRVPVGIIAGVEHRLSEQAVQELIAAEQTAPAGPTPMSRMSVARPGPWRLLVESAAVRRVAMAAAIVLCIGGGWMLASNVLRAWPQKNGRATLARSGSNYNARGGAASMRTSEIIGTPDAEVAAGVTSESTDATNPDAPLTGEASPTLATMSEPSEAVPAALSIDRALALAAQGRLAVRVRTLDSAALTKRIDSLAHQRELSGSAMRSLALSGIPTHYASLLTPATTLDDPGLSRPDRPRHPTAIADDSVAPARVDGSPVAVGPPSPVSIGRAHAEVSAIYLADVPERSGEIEQLLSLLSRAQRAVSGSAQSPTAAFVTGATLEELPEAIIDDAPSLDPADVLWWTNPGAKWARSLRVPVIIETLTSGD